MAARPTQIPAAHKARHTLKTVKDSHGLLIPASKIGDKIGAPESLAKPAAAAPPASLRRVSMRFRVILPCGIAILFIRALD
jgi:hypothetical protein